MGLKAVAGGQISNANTTTDLTSLKNKPTENTIDLTETTLAADKKFGTNYLGSFNRARVEQKFAAQQQTTRGNQDINGITTATNFEIKVAADESQESVLKQAFEQMARQAGLSDEKVEGADLTAVESFVKERMGANTTDKGEVHILSRTTQQPFSAKEWAEFQKSGSITVNPTADDIAALKSYKNTGDSADYKAGQDAADELMKAVNEGFNIWNYQPLSGETVPPAVSAALEKISGQQGSSDFQEGLINKLGADNFLKAEKYLNGTPYENVMRSSLSAASQNSGSVVRVDSSDKETVSVQRQIGQKADVETLLRLTSDPNQPMNTDFLVAAGKKAASSTLTFDADFKLVQDYNPKANTLFQTIAKDKNASLELLQDKIFVQNGLTLTWNDENNQGFNDLLKAGTSTEARTQNPAMVDNVLNNLGNVLKNPDEFRPKGDVSTNVWWNKNTVSPQTADTLAEVYRNNIDIFSDAAGLKSSTDFDENKAKSIFSAINQYESPKESALLTTKAKVAELLYKSVAENNPNLANNARVLANNFADSEAETLLEQAKQADKKQERVANIFSAATDVIGKTGISKAGVGGMSFEFALKMTSNEVKNATKGNNVENTQSVIKDKRLDQQAAMKISLLTAYEQTAFIKSSGISASKDEKESAEIFLQNLKVYNNQLPDNEKILDSNGRLLKIEQTNEAQQGIMQRIVDGKTKSTMLNREKGQIAADNLSKAMGQTGLYLGIKGGN